MAGCSAPAAEQPVIEQGVGPVGAKPAAPTEDYPEYGTTAGANCQERGLGRFLNKRSTPALAAEARVASGSATVRIIRPKDLITQDRRKNRLNLTLDAAGNIAGARCF